ncbi:putative permease [Mycolicibacterium chubuense NBB4]|uniref:Putative permease n=1 Tax=Mycolicibacterium chubuense (strain NBB4) TaxID=710421 RepID=I4BGQ9_MYCCN|nr:sodium-dependent bicarbonate transport family permease [Mycolicibacterium chubuense]AFM16466.1 putative permease [Mycolicibacterium chubuense NBB4]
MVHDFLANFQSNLFKPLLLFFYFGFLIPILKVEFEFPYAVYQGLTMYLLLAVGWHGGEQLALIHPSSIGTVAGFMVLGFLTNLIVGVVAYLLLSRTTPMRRVDTATVAGYYGSDSAGTFATCVAVLTAAGLAFDAYMPVMLAVMEVPGCLVAIYLVSRLRRRGMDPLGNMPDEPGYDRHAERQAVVAAAAGHAPTRLERAVEDELELSLEKREHPESGGISAEYGKQRLISASLLRELFLNPGLCLLFGGLIIGLLSGLQGAKAVESTNVIFNRAFEGLLCLFLFEMGMRASRKLKDVRSGGRGLVVFGLLAPNLFATFGILVARCYAVATHTHFEPGTYVLFALLCGSASYIAVPAVQRLAIPEASPTLPLAASLGLTFPYNVTIGIPVYMEISRAVGHWLPVT